MSSFIPPSQNGHLLELDLRDLSVDHPLLAGIPVWDGQSAEFVALRDDVAARGLDYPLLVDNSYRVVDGRNRRNVVRALGSVRGCRPNCVPVRVVDQDEAASIIVSSLVNRRHLTKGAIAYLIVPFLEPVLQEIRKHQIANVTRRASAEQTLGTTTGELAARMGFGRELIFQASRVRDLFETHAEKHPDLRARIEPAILSGDLGLGGAIVAITNVVENAKRAKQLHKRAQHARLFKASLGKLALHWKKGDEAERERIWRDARESMLDWPAELVADFAKIARDVDREKAKQVQEGAA